MGIDTKPDLVEKLLNQPKQLDPTKLIPVEGTPPYTRNKERADWELPVLTIGVAILAAVVIFIAYRIYRQGYLTNWRIMFINAYPITRLIIVLPFFWSVSVSLYIFLFNPYGGGMNDNEIIHMLSLMLFPSFILILGYFLYTKVINPKD